MDAHFSRVLKSELGEIPVLAEAFEAWAEGLAIPPGVVFQTNVVLDELITNVVLYGLGEGKPGEIGLDAHIDGGFLRMELRDNAAPFDPFSVPPPNLTGSVDEREVGGLGVHFVRSMMDEWRYERLDDWNVVSLGKRLAEA